MRNRGADDHFIMLTGIDDEKILTSRMEMVNETIRKVREGKEVLACETREEYEIFTKKWFEKTS